MNKLFNIKNDNYNNNYNDNDENGNTSLIFTCLKNNYEKTKIILDCYYHNINDIDYINKPNYLGFFPLLIAYENKNMEISKLLIEYGADYNNDKIKNFVPYLFEKTFGKHSNLKYTRDSKFFVEMNKYIDKINNFKIGFRNNFLVCPKRHFEKHKEKLICLLFIIKNMNNNGGIRSILKYIIIPKLFN